MITGAQAIVDCLRREGVDLVFGIPGTMNLPILDVLRATPEIRFVLTRHEQGAAFMAYGYARSIHKPAIVTATEGPGVTNPRPASAEGSFDLRRSRRRCDNEFAWETYHARNARVGATGDTADLNTIALDAEFQS